MTVTAFVKHIPRWQKGGHVANVPVNIESCVDTRAWEGIRLQFNPKLGYSKPTTW